MKVRVTYKDPDALYVAADRLKMSREDRFQLIESILGILGDEYVTLEVDTETKAVTFVHPTNRT